ncbi:MAG TPA: peptidoglycan DD-metalloendopeptidase family protein [Acidimicrobiales bacterium]|nr:peptidoglycan DD-metalloendopeptidase family protein [Acidimicrobiales bacterium]
MAYRVGQAFIDVAPSLRGFQKAINKEIQNQFKNGLKVPVTPQISQSTRQQAQRAGADAGGAYAREFKKRVEAALQTLPTIEVNADTTEAEAEVESLRRHLERLRDMKVGVDIDAWDAIREIRGIHRSLERLSTDSAEIQVEADAGAAAAHLAAISQQADALDGKTVNIDVDVDKSGQAIGSLRFLSGSINSVLVTGALLGPALIPGLAGAAAAAIGLGSALSGVGIGLGGLIAAALPAISRVTEAVQAQEAAEKSAFTSSSGNAMQRVSDAYAVAAAAERVEDAQRQADRAAVDGARAVENAVENVARARERAADMVEQAEENLADASQDVIDAQEAQTEAQLELNQAREDALETLYEMKELVDDLALGEQQAALALEQAQNDLAEIMNESGGTAVEAGQQNLANAQAELNALQDSGIATQLQLAQAQLAVTQAQEALNAAMLEQEQLALDQQQAALDVAEAEDHLSDILHDQQNAQEALAEANQQGIDGMPAVVSAQEALADASQSVADAVAAQADAQENLADVQVEAARLVSDAQEQAAVASENAARAQADAARAVSQALTAQSQQAQMAAMQVDQGSEATRNLAYAMGQLTPMQRQLMAGWLSLKDAFTSWAEELEPAVLPLFIQGMQMIEDMLPHLTPIVLSAANAIGYLLDLAGETFKDPVWQEFFAMIAATAGPNIAMFGEILLNLGTAFAAILTAFAPFASQFLAGLVEMTEKFAAWASSTEGQNAIQGFIDYVLDMWPQVKETLNSLWDVLVSIVEALTPLAGPVLATLEGFFGTISSLPPGVLAALAGGFLTIALGIKAASIAQAALNLGLKGMATIGIIGLLIAIAAYIVHLWQTSETFRTVVTAVFDAVWGAIKFVWEWIKDNWKLLLIILSGPFAPFVALFIKHFDTIKNTVMGVINWVRDNWRGIVDFFLDPILWVIDQVSIHSDTIKGIFWALVNGIIGFFSGMFDVLGDIFGGLLDLITDPVGTIIRWINKHLIGNLNKITKLFGFEIPTIDFGGGSSAGPPQTGHGNGDVIAMNSGGLVPGGGPDRDSVHTFLTPGEGVISRGRMSEIAAEMGTNPATAAARINAGSGGPFDFIGDIASGAWGAISSIGSQIGDWLKEGAAYAADKLMTPLVDNVAHVVPGPEFVQTFFRGALGKAKEVIVDWAEGKDSEEDKTPAGFDANGKFGFPLPRGAYTVGRGPKGHGYNAWDFPAVTGTPVFAPMAGTLKQVNVVGSYGRHIYVQAGKLAFLVAHLSKQVGANMRQVARGDLVGRVGSTGNSTGPHAHVEVRLGGSRQDPANYLTFDSGGMLMPGLTLAYNGTGRPERILDASESYQYDRGSSGGGTVFQIYGTPSGLVHQVAFDIESKRRARRPLMTG